jgi:3-oxoacyl-[acyl-carrier-protein] synthase-1
MGFDSLQILDHDFCRPFRADRRGLNLAEGGALFLLEAPDGVDSPRPLAFLTGAGAASDAYHMTHPDPEARGMELAMRRALADACLAPGDVGYVNAHGTGTIPNDQTESLALARIFTDAPYSSTKELHGPTLGGAGALEAAVAIAALAEGEVWLPAQTGAKPRRKPLAHALSNSFGFGGNNVSLVFSREVRR